MCEARFLIDEISSGKECNDLDIKLIDKLIERLRRDDYFDILTNIMLYNKFKILDVLYTKTLSDFNVSYVICFYIDNKLPRDYFDYVIRNNHEFDIYKVIIKTIQNKKYDYFNIIKNKFNIDKEKVITDMLSFNYNFISSDGSIKRNKIIQYIISDIENVSNELLTKFILKFSLYINNEDLNVLYENGFSLHICEWKFKQDIIEMLRHISDKDDNFVCFIKFNRFNISQAGLKKEDKEWLLSY